MDSRPTRKIEILDLFILVAATAIGLAATRYYVGSPSSTILLPKIDVNGVLSLIPTRRVIGARESATIGSLMLAAWSPALLWVWFRSPVTRLQTLLQRPSVAAAAVATLGVIAYLAWHLRAGWPTGKSPQVNYGGQAVTVTIDLLPFVLDKLGQTVGPAVVATWLVLAAKRRGSFSADWIDRFGLALCLAWLLLSIERLR